MKNIILFIVSIINLFVFVTAGCCLDSDSWIPFIAMCITGSWLALFTYANNGFGRR